jgi:uncharacterized membrane protein YfcA
LTKNGIKTIWLCVIGAVAGVINGMFGSAGGILAVDGLRRLERDEKKAHATATIVILPLCVISAAVYFINGRLDPGAALRVAAGAAVGGILGGRLLGRISDKWLDIIYFAVLLAAGIRMLSA